MSHRILVFLRLLSFRPELVGFHETPRALGICLVKMRTT